MSRNLYTSYVQYKLNSRSCSAYKQQALKEGRDKDKLYTAEKDPLKRSQLAWSPAGVGSCCDEKRHYHGRMPQELDNYSAGSKVLRWR